MLLRYFPAMATRWLSRTYSLIHIWHISDALLEGKIFLNKSIEQLAKFPLIFLLGLLVESSSYGLCIVVYIFKARLSPFSIWLLFWFFIYHFWIWFLASYQKATNHNCYFFIRTYYRTWKRIWIIQMERFKRKYVKEFSYNKMIQNIVDESMYE